MIGNSYLETETNKKLETAVKDSINIIKNEKFQQKFFSYWKLRMQFTMQGQISREICPHMEIRQDLHIQ